MNIYTGLLFNQGHLQDPALVRSLAQETNPPGTGEGPADADPKPQPAQALPEVRRRRGWVELQGALLAAFR